jgi:GntR family transcriptional regulator, transcriptional repressor for pyruvate dehydrogenase complex
VNQMRRASPKRSLADVIDEIRGPIHRGEFGPGDRLPSERELAANLGGSRDRLRAALAALEADGYLVSRRGATGGRFVTELASPFATWAARTAHELDDIVDFRLAVECQAARFAADRRTAHDLERMCAAVTRLDAVGTPREYRLADVSFHASVAVASGNDRLAAAVERARGELFEPADVLWEDGQNESLVDHSRILSAIQTSNAAGAAAAMAEHIEHTRSELHRLLRRVRGTHDR